MKKKIVFEEGVAELETLVQKLESGALPLAESFDAYERAMKLSVELKALLDEGDKRILALRKAAEDVRSEDISEEVRP